MGISMIRNVARAIGCIDADRCNGRRKAGTCGECLKVGKAAIIAALPHIKEAMEYHGVEGAMNKLIIKRLEDKLK